MILPLPACSCSKQNRFSHFDCSKSHSKRLQALHQKYKDKILVSKFLHNVIRNMHQRMRITKGAMLLLQFVLHVANASAASISQSLPSFSYKSLPPHVSISKVPSKSSLRYLNQADPNQIHTIQQYHQDRYLFKVQEDFITVCYGNLTSTASTSDGNITTIDVYNFIKLVDDNVTTNYLSINVLVQLEWIWTLCPSGLNESEQCKSKLEEMNDYGYDYGFLLNDTNSATSIYKKVKGFCERIWYIYRTIGEYISC